LPGPTAIFWNWLGKTKSSERTGFANGFPNRFGRKFCSTAMEITGRGPPTLATAGTGDRTSVWATRGHRERFWSGAHFCLPELFPKRGRCRMKLKGKGNPLGPLWPAWWDRDSLGKHLIMLRPNLGTNPPVSKLPLFRYHFVNFRFSTSSGQNI